MTRIEFIRAKDGHQRGEVLSLEEGDWRLAYWRKKGCISTLDAEAVEDREAYIEPATQDPVQEPKQKRRRRRK